MTYDTSPQKRWVAQPLITAEADSALQKFPRILRQIAYNRGLFTEEKARAYFNAKPEADKDYNPLGMNGMAQAVERIRYAIQHQEPIAIYGDYDVDGVTATALLVEALQFLNADARGYIPNRFEEGYGLNNNALEELKAGGIKLVITVDCGIRSPDEAQRAKDIGLDLIISDHHHPAEGSLPPALAVINPKQHGDAYPDKDLAGVGIAYKIAQALLEDGSPNNASMLNSLLDLVALGTVADLAPLMGENRILVRKGLMQMRQTQRQGLFSLAAVSEIALPKVTAVNIGFGLGPRLNAAGRLKEALAAFELLTTKDSTRAGILAQELNIQNRERQELTRKMQARAEEIAMRDDPGAFLLFAAHPEFNSGVIGLAASRLTETHYRPSIVAAQGEEETRGSCRSIPEFHITDALDLCSDLLVRHGGHAAAAGFTVKNENLPELVSRLKQIAKEKLDGQDLRATLTADVEVSLAEMRGELYEKGLRFLEPTGYGNPTPIFMARSVKVKNSRTVGADAKHLKLQVEDETGMTHDCIGFRLGEWHGKLPARVDLMFTYEPNEYNGRVTYQLNVKDLRPSGSAMKKQG